jgi:hypothetical protein
VEELYEDDEEEQMLRKLFTRSLRNHWGQAQLADLIWASWHQNLWICAIQWWGQ